MANEAMHYFPGGWAFFTGFSKKQNDVHFGAFLTEDAYKGFNKYVSSTQDPDLPPTAVLIPF